jgi:hypothetical protein
MSNISVQKKTGGQAETKSHLTVPRTTLGDLIVATYARAEATTSDRDRIGRMAARVLENQLTKAGRADLIRSLASAERRFDDAIPLRGRRQAAAVRRPLVDVTVPTAA